MISNITENVNVSPCCNEYDSKRAGKCICRKNNLKMKSLLRLKDNNISIFINIYIYIYTVGWCKDLLKNYILIIVVLSSNLGNTFWEYYNKEYKHLNV